MSVGQVDWTANCSNLSEYNITYVIIFLITGRLKIYRRTEFLLDLSICFKLMNSLLEKKKKRVEVLLARQGKINALVTSY